MHEVLVNRLGGLSLPRKSVVRLTDCPDMTLDVYSGRKTTIQQQQSLGVTGVDGFNIEVWLILFNLNMYGWNFVSLVFVSVNLEFFTSAYSTRCVT